jgi:hypothetical protein
MKGAIERGYLAAQPLSSLFARAAPPVRDLGLAIVVVAIADYCGRDEELHRDAAHFLFPKTEAARRHYAWAVAIQDKVNAAWLREELDRARPAWDAEREASKRKDYEKRIRLGNEQLQDWHSSAAGAPVQPAHAAGVAGTYAAAPGV